ncbi:MAG: hypothetical protein HOP11_05255 [Saprospiraceae bacterium]|nr:hypothetical protein [Saprospiraceae bacterium]
MKNSSFFHKVLPIFILFSSMCCSKNKIKDSTEKKPSTDMNNTHSSHGNNQRETNPTTVNSNSNSTIEKDSLNIYIHPSPDQEKIDSIKAANAKAKKKK